MLGHIVKGLCQKKICQRVLLIVFLFSQISPVWGAKDPPDTSQDTSDPLHTLLLQSLEAEEDPWTAPIQNVRQAFSQAPRELQEEARRLLPNLLESTLSLWPPHLLREEEDLKRALPLPSAHSAFERLNAVLQALEILDPHPDMTTACRTSLRALRDIYQTYQSDLSTGSPERRRFLLSAISFKTDFSPQTYLISSHIASGLLSIDRFGIPTKRNTTGSSIVTQVGSLYAKQNCLVTHVGEAPYHTLNPPLEWAMSAFHRLLFGEGLVPSAVIQVMDVLLPDKPLSLEKEQEKRALCTEAMDRNLSATQRKAHQARLHEDLTLKATQSYLLQITPEVKGEFLSHFLKQALQDKSLFDALALANVQELILSAMLTNPADAKGDNLIVTFPDQTGKRQIISIDNDLSLAADIIEEKPGYHSLEARHILFAIPQLMEWPLLEEVRTRFLSHTPPAFLLKWLKALACHQERYRQLEDPQQKLRLSFTFCPSTLPTLLKKFTTLQNCVRGNHTLTLHQLFEELSRLAALTYKASRDTLPPLQAFDQIYRRDPSLEEVLKAESQKDIQALLNAERTFENAYKNRTQSLGNAVLEFYAAIDLSFLPLPQRLLFVQDAYLAFQEQARMTQHPSWHDPSLLYEACRTPLDGSVLTFLIERFRDHVNKADERLGTPLHCVIQNPHIDSALRYSALLFAQGALSEVKDSQGLTPLDCLMARPEAPRLALFKALVGAYKAGRDANPDSALKFYRWVKEKDLLLSLTPLFDLLEQRNPAIEWHLTLAHLLPCSGEAPLGPLVPVLDTSGFSALCDLPDVKKAYAPQASLLLRGATLGERLILDNLVPQLINAQGQVIKRNVSGNHIVGRLTSGKRHLYVKFYPELPGYEEAVGLLTREMMGFGCPHTELFRLGDVPLLISQGIRGESLNAVLMRHPQDLTHLDPQSLSAMILMAMLINPEDGKPDNYIFEALPDDSTHFRPVSIDNDHAFVPSIAKEQREGLLRKVVVQVKTLLYSLDQMEKAVHPEARKSVLDLHVGDVLEGWMCQLRGRNQSYRELFTTPEVLQLLGTHDTYIGIPFEKGAIERLYDKFVRLQRFLFDQPTITHLNLLCRLEPDLGQRYQKGFEKPLTPRARFKLLDEPFYQKTKDGHHVTMIKSGHILNTKNIPLQQSLLQMMKSEATHDDRDFRPDMALKVLKDIRKQHAETTLLAHILPACTNPQLNRQALQTIRLDSRLAEILKDIDFRNVNEPDQQAIFDFLREKELDSLILRNARALTDRILTTLNLKKIETLHLPGCLALTDEIFPLLTQIPHLASLNLSDLSKLVGVAQKVKGFWGGVTLDPLSFPALRVLTISRCSNVKTVCLHAPLLEHLLAEACPLLDSLQGTMPRLTRFVCKGATALTDSGLDSLIQGCPEIQELDIEGCSLITEKELRKRYPFCPASYLSGKAKESIPRLLKNDSTLTRLDLQFDNLKAAEGMAIAKALEKNTTLESLNLMGNHLNAAAGVAIAKALEKNTTLESLYLGENNLNAAGGMAIAKALEKNTTLTHLDLLGNHLDEAGGVAIAKALEKNTTLTYLELWSNDLNEAVGVAIAEALQNNTTLTYLDLGHNKLNDATIKTINQLLSRNQKLAQERALMGDLRA